MPRKALLGSPRCHGRIRFNEAEAVMPRKAIVPPYKVAKRPWASMRPRLLCPGKRGARKANLLRQRRLQ